jgi:hypothetical protein
MWSWLWIVALIAGFVPAVVTVVTYISIKKMSRPDLPFEPAVESQWPDGFRLVREHVDWATREGFDVVGTYTVDAMQRMFVAAWLHNEYPVYFCIYYHAQTETTVYDFVSLYEGDRGLTTGSTADAVFIPQPPDSYVQAFTDKTLDELWDLHLVSEQYVLNQLRLAPKRIDRPFEQVVIGAIHKQMGYVQSLPFWPLRTAWWYFVRRGRIVNLTIEQQQRKGYCSFEASRL